MERTIHASQRPRGGAHLENDRYWGLSVAELRYIITDAGEALRHNPTGEPAGKWMDQINDACTVIATRKGL